MKQLLALLLIVAFLTTLPLACSKKKKGKADTRGGHRTTTMVSAAIPPARAESETCYATATDILFKQRPELVGRKLTLSPYKGYVREKLSKGEPGGAVYLTAARLKIWRDALSESARDSFAIRCIDLADGAQAGVYREPPHVRDPFYRFRLYEAAFNFAVSDEIKIKASLHYQQAKATSVAAENWEQLNKQPHVSPKMRRSLRLHPRRWDKSPDS